MPVRQTSTHHASPDTRSTLRYRPVIVVHGRVPAEACVEWQKSGAARAVLVLPDLKLKLARFGLLCTVHDVARNTSCAIHCAASNAATDVRIRHNLQHTQPVEPSVRALAVHLRHASQLPYATLAQLIATICPSGVATPRRCGSKQPLSPFISLSIIVVSTILSMTFTCTVGIKLSDWRIVWIHRRLGSCVTLRADRRWATQCRPPSYRVATPEML